MCDRTKIQCLFSTYILYRAIGVYFPQKLNDNGFRMKSKLIIVLAWMFAFIPMVPGLFGQFGKYGLECKTRNRTES